MRKLESLKTIAESQNMDLVRKLKEAEKGGRGGTLRRKPPDEKECKDSYVVRDFIVTTVHLVFYLRCFHPDFFVKLVFQGVKDPHWCPRCSHAHIWFAFGPIMPNHLNMPKTHALNLYTNFYPD